jgi:DNA invertase Pin-like site-specific DNA recombinase
MTKAFVYLRVSGKGQVGGDGFPRQIAAVKAYAAANNIRIVKTFREEGVSGANELADRPQFASMMLALEGNGVELVLVEALHRLARDLMIQESILADMKRHGFRLISVAEPDLCSDDPSRKLMRQIMGAFSEYEKTMIVTKLKVARDRKKAAADDNRCEGRKPYGYYNGERAILDRIQALREGGATYAAIAAKLNAEGVAPRKVGASWHPGHVHGLLHLKPLGRE